ncbi:MAG: hypothetical protein HPY89_13345 [Pelotomaculum sp.]|nr:hypothetical protein [Pelotomaculum sp.]
MIYYVYKEHTMMCVEVAVEQPYSVWRRIYTVEPHNAEWREFIIADDAEGNIKVLESPPGSKICWIESINVNKA